MKYVALLRGINVGKGARVPMGALKSLLEGNGLDEVVTYLNSGNVLFRSPLSAPEVTGLLEDELERAFGERIPTLVKTAAEVIAIAASIPGEFRNIKRQNDDRSQITRIVAHGSYARMTTRNVNTARKLAALCAEA